VHYTKKWLSVAAVVVLCLALVIGVACGGGGGEDEEGVTEIKLGHAAPQSGIMGAVAGVPGQRGIELMADQIGVFEVGGKQYRWKPIFEDNEGASASGGMASTTKLIYTDNVDFVVQQGAAAMASQTLCEESGVLIDLGNATFNAYGPDHPYSVQSGPCFTVHLAPFYDFLSKEHPEVERIVVIAYDDPLMIAFMEAFESNMHEYFGFEVKIIRTPLGADPYPIATTAMTEDADLVIASVTYLDVMWDMGYEGLSAPYGPIASLAQLEDAGWSDCKGMMFFWPEWYGADEVWPEAVAFAVDFEARYSVSMDTIALASGTLLQSLTGALQQAGTVDDTDKIMEAVYSGTPFDSIVGPMYYGGEAFVDVNCLLMMPVAIWEIVGDNEYELLEYYTPEEAEAIAVEAWTATMP
jgi:ABC-type branched-subunit amino acid transport system substrate-binding protein